VLAAREIYKRRVDLGDALSSMPIGDLALSFVCALAGVAITMLGWRDILASMGARLTVRQGARVFFIGQLGKYLPGSVWPLLAQAELAKQVGAKRTVTVAGNLIFTGVMVTVGVLLGAALLPFTSPGVFDDYWWLLLVLPFLLLGLYPPLVRWGVDLLLGVLRRPKLDGPINPRLYARSVVVILVSWLLLGTHIYLLVRALGPRDPTAFVASVGGIGLATGAGILFIPAPAGAGIREVVLTLALSPLLTSDQALSVALVSRVAMILTDFILGGSQAFSGRAARRQAMELAHREAHAGTVDEVLAAESEPPGRPVER